MMTVYDIEIKDEAVVHNLDRICNQIFKLLPMREEGTDYIKPLETLIIELLGMNVLIDDQKDLFALVCKLQGLHQGGEEIDFLLYRRTIFECCGLVGQVKKYVTKDLSC